MRPVARAISVLLSGLVLAACSSTPEPKAPPSEPPSPKSVTLEHPGGDASDPHWAALTRLLEQPQGMRMDKDGQLKVPLPDTPNWKRVRFSLIQHFVGFRYGKDLHALDVVFVEDAPADADHYECMRILEKWAEPQLEDFGVEVGPVREERVLWRKHKGKKELPQPVLVHIADGRVDVGFERWEGTVAWAAYAAYPGTCLGHAFAVPWRGHEALARKVVDRWVEDAVPALRPKTKTRPYRRE